MDELGAVLQGDPEDGVEPRVDPTAQPVPGLEEHDLGAPGQGGGGREPRGASADHDHALHVRTPPPSPGRVTAASTSIPSAPAAASAEDEILVFT